MIKVYTLLFLNNNTTNHCLKCLHLYVRLFDIYTFSIPAFCFVSTSHTTRPHFTTYDLHTGNFSDNLYKEGHRFSLRNR